MSISLDSPNMYATCMVTVCCRSCSLYVAVGYLQHTNWQIALTKLDLWVAYQESPSTARARAQERLGCNPPLACMASDQASFEVSVYQGHSPGGSSRDTICCVLKISHITKQTAITHVKNCSSLGLNQAIVVPVPASRQLDGSTVPRTVVTASWQAGEQGFLNHSTAGR